MLNEANQSTSLMELYIGLQPVVPTGQGGGQGAGAAGAELCEVSPSLPGIGTAY